MKFKEAAKALGEVDFESISPEEKAFYCLLRVECGLPLGDYGTEEYINHSLRYYLEKQYDENFARAKLLQGWRLMLKTEYFEAREALTEAVAAYRKCNSDAGQARAFCRLGYVYLQFGDLETAENYTRRAAQYYERQQDYARLGNILLSLVGTVVACGYFQKGMMILREIEPNLPRLTEMDQGSYYATCAFPAAVTGDFAQAYRSINTAIQIMEAFPREKARCLYKLGRILLLDDNPAKAEGAFSEGLRIVVNYNAAAAESYKRHLAEIYLKLGRLEDAREYLETAAKLAEEMTDRSEIAHCYRIRALLAVEESRDAEAREEFREALGIFSRINHRYYLAVTRYQAAISGLFPPGEQQAMLYLAREYFESEKLVPYIEKVKSAILPDIAPPMRIGRMETKPPTIIAVNAEVKRLLNLAHRAAQSDISILLTGETGTGKDLLAEYIHHCSDRTGRFVAVNSAAIPENMIEAELFGYSRGAYTGADREKTGLIEEANDGTLYLNEIADSSPAFQAKLLDALERKVIRRLGENTERAVAFRLIAATNHDIEKLVDEGRFRIDLYHRISEISINLPPLSERPDDIPELVRHFLSLGGVSFDPARDGRELDEIYVRLQSRRWPGNIRQLKSELARLILLSHGDLHRMKDAMDEGRQVSSIQDRLATTLEMTGWNRREAARELGINEITVRRWIKKLNLRPPLKNHGK
ncbi:MAG: sigma 54-interacting transcriptional regulator [candidate division Zixibacteria bacterium]|nr:sigma 54-interacting transcriptional regulator [candidate division Zixibacteria bacterium]